MKLYVGNLPWSVDDKALKKLFASYGVEEVVLIKDKYSGRSKGFGFVTVSDDETGNKAISEMHKKEIEGRALTVSEAKPMVPRDNAPRYNDANRSEESAEAPMADSSVINNTVEDETPEVVDDNSDAEEGEEKIETVEEAKEDAESDEPEAEEEVEPETEEEAKTE